MPTKHLKIIEQFLKDRKSIDEVPESGFPFITISRQAGAGGHLLSYVLMTDFLKEKPELFRDWHVFDRLLCEIVAEDPSLHESLEFLVRERFRSEFQEIVDTLIAGMSSQYTLYRKTFQVISMLAAVGKVIIVGRAASLVTLGFKTGIHIRLVAPEPKRIDWVAKRFKLSREEARKAVRKQDKERQRLGEMFFNKNIEDPLLYDAVWNTDSADMHEISQSIIQMIKFREKKRLELF